MNKLEKTVTNTTHLNDIGGIEVVISLYTYRTESVQRIRNKNDVCYVVADATANLGNVYLHILTTTTAKRA